MTDASRAPRWPGLIVVLAPLLLGAPFVFGGRVPYWGTPLLQFYPWRQFALDALRAGYVPLWNPLVGNGAPLIANYQSAIFYPPNWLALILPLDVTLGWLIVLHWLWAGLGMVTLARALDLKPLGQAVAGLAFGVSQCLVARSGFLSINAAIAWLPWVIWAGERAVRGEWLVVSGQRSANRQPPTAVSHQIRSGLNLSLCVAMQLLAGHAQTAWYTLLLLAAWVLWRGLFQPPSTVVRHFSLVTRNGHWSSVIWRSSLVIAFLLLAFGLAAVQLLPTTELLQHSPRATAAGYDFVMNYSLSPWRLLTFFAPDVLGNPARGVFYGYGNYWEDALYFGLLPAVFAFGLLIKEFVHLLDGVILRRAAPKNLLAMVEEGDSSLAPLAQNDGQKRLHPHSLILFLSAVVFVTTLFALGRNTPIFPFLYRYVPTFNLFQAPARMLMIAVFALALLAGLGVDGWQKPRGWGLYWVNLGAAGALMMALTAGVVWVYFPAHTALGAQLRTVAQALLLCGVGLFAIAMLALFKPRTESRGWQWAVAALVALDLIIANAGLNPVAPADMYRAPSATGPALSAALNGHRLFYFPADEYAVKFGLLSFKAFGSPELAYATRAAQVPNVASLDGLASANNFEPLVSARYADLLDTISATRSLNLLRLMDVSVVASRAVLDWDVVAQTEAVTFYRVPTLPQRVWLTYAARTVPDAASARAALAAPDFDPAAAVILEADDAGARPRHSLPARINGSPNTVSLSVTLTQPGWVVLSDSDYAGWAVFVDGQPATLLHGDYAFRAVAVDAGTHTVTFDYQPRSFEIGLWLTALSALLWLGLFLASHLSPLTSHL